MELILASNNKNKIKEINEVLPANMHVVSLQDAGIFEEIEEPFDTFEANALAKAQYVFEKTGKPTFSEDSGLVVPALDGAPGVYSARYAGESPRSDIANTNKLLREMDSLSAREAYYQTVICLVGMGEPKYFKGICEGRIAAQSIGDKGFGYDPVFIPRGYDDSFGVLPEHIKKSISHRSKAVKLLLDFLSENVV